MHEWNVYPDHKQASVAAADALAQNIITCLEEKGICHVILPGGNTPQDSLAHLARSDVPWEKVHWYPGDERCYPEGHAERNDVMLQRVFWTHLGTTHIHTIPAELGPEAAAARYRDEIASIHQFDIAFLGLGEDGHTASLFPGNAALQDERSVVPVFNSPKPPDERVSLSLSTLAKTRFKSILATGSGKAGILQRIQANEPLPVNCLGKIDWYIDTAAAMQ